MGFQPQVFINIVASFPTPYRRKIYILLCLHPYQQVGVTSKSKANATLPYGGILKMYEFELYFDKRYGSEPNEDREDLRNEFY
jgi:hypothetical protein